MATGHQARHAAATTPPTRSTDSEFASCTCVQYKENQGKTKNNKNGDVKKMIQRIRGEERNGPGPAASFSISLFSVFFLPTASSKQKAVASGPAAPRSPRRARTHTAGTPRHPHMHPACRPASSPPPRRAARARARPSTHQHSQPPARHQQRPAPHSGPREPPYRTPAQAHCLRHAPLPATRRPPPLPRRPRLPHRRHHTDTHTHTHRQLEQLSGFRAPTVQISRSGT